MTIPVYMMSDADCDALLSANDETVHVNAFDFGDGLCLPLSVLQLPAAAGHVTALADLAPFSSDAPDASQETLDPAATASLAKVADFSSSITVKIGSGGSTPRQPPAERVAVFVDLPDVPLPDPATPISTGILSAKQKL